MTMDLEATSAFHLGRPELDPEHQGQIDLLLAVEAELRGARDPAQLSRLLDGLVEYTNIHFMSEQLIMRQHVYPGLPAHEAEHDQLMEQMRNFQKRIGSGERNPRRRQPLRLARLGAPPYPHQTRFAAAIA